MIDSLVSVAIPAYKGKYLEKTIESVLNQTYKNFELIIVNDQSPEDLGSIVESLADKRIRYYVNDVNLGREDPANNWNKCLSYAKGEFFCLLCDDDIYRPTFIEEMLSLANAYPNCNVFRARCGTIDRDGILKDLYPSSPSWELSEDYMYHVFKGVRHQTISEWFYRTEDLRVSGAFVHFPLAWHADYFSIFLISRNGGIVSTNIPLVFFRMSGENISSNNKTDGLKKAQANFEAYQAAKELITKADSLYKPILSVELESWKKMIDSNLLSTLILYEKIKVIFHMKRYCFRLSSIVRGVLLSFR